MADLAGEAADAAMEPAVEDDARRDPGADAEVGEVADVRQDPALVQASGGGADVVLDCDRDAVTLGDQADEREVVPAEVHGEGHAARDRVDPAGDADADGQRGRRRFGRRCASAASTASAIRLTA